MGFFELRLSLARSPECVYLYSSSYVVIVPEASLLCVRRHEAYSMSSETAISWGGRSALRVATGRADFFVAVPPQWQAMALVDASRTRPVALAKRFFGRELRRTASVPESAKVLSRSFVDSFRCYNVWWGVPLVVAKEDWVLDRGFNRPQG